MPVKNHRNDRSHAAGEAMPMTPAEFGKLAAAETEKWAKLIRSANIKPE